MGLHVFRAHLAVMSVMALSAQHIVFLKGFKHLYTIRRLHFLIFATSAAQSVLPTFLDNVYSAQLPTMLIKTQTGTSSAFLAPLIVQLAKQPISTEPTS